MTKLSILLFISVFLSFNSELKADDYNFFSAEEGFEQLASIVEPQTTVCHIKFTSVDRTYKASLFCSSGEVKKIKINLANGPHHTEAYKVSLAIKTLGSKNLSLLDCDKYNLATSSQYTECLFVRK